MIFVIGGVTASGKSDLAFKLAREIGGVIINGDAFAIYRELNIGTAKPSNEELNSVPTFLFNVVSLDETYSIYDYQQNVRALLTKFSKENTPVIIVGGSGLYIRAALHDYKLNYEEPTPFPDDETLTNEELHNRLKRIDDEAGRKIHPNNRKRVLRALTLIQNQQVLKSEVEEETKGRVLFPYTMVVIDPDKEVLNDRILTRTKRMFTQGLKKEVETILERFSKEAQGLQAIGYKEVIKDHYLNDEALILLISTKTRQLAKRQRTFFRNQFNGVWFKDSNAAYNYLIEISRRKSNE